MKTAKNLYHRIVLFENLLDAAKKAAKGKRERRYVLEFFEKLEDNIFQLQEELRNLTYKPGNYTTFSIYEPKKRMISAAPFRDRVVHHALINIIGPILEKSFIYDNYANRKGKGTHLAIRRYQRYLRTFTYVLKCDIKKYFPTIDHIVLKQMIRKKIGDKPTLWLVDLIIDSSNVQEFVCDYFPDDSLFSPLDRRKGLPIGNLTSQYFANFYLDRLDHFIKETLGCKGYVRFVDDFVLFSNSKRALWHWLRRIERFLEKLRLKLNPNRIMLYPAKVGTAFLGQMIFKSHRRLCNKNVRKFYKRLNMWKNDPPVNLQQRLAGWKGHASQADTQGLLAHLDVF